MSIRDIGFAADEAIRCLPRWNPWRCGGFSTRVSEPENNDTSIIEPIELAGTG